MGELKDPAKSGAHAQRRQELQAKGLGEGGAVERWGLIDHRGSLEEPPDGPSNKSQPGPGCPPNPRAQKTWCPSRLGPHCASSARDRVRSVGKEYYTFLTQAPLGLLVMGVLPAPSPRLSLVVTRSGHAEPSLMSRKVESGTPAAGPSTEVSSRLGLRTDALGALHGRALS